jgi:hypothetical protein
MEKDLMSDSSPRQRRADAKQREERTSFQSSGGYTPRTHLNADVAMVYGIDKSLPERLKTWRDKGYICHVMTGVAWGEYQDYLYGRFDGKNHEDEAQTERDGKRISHGRDVYYMSPGESYGKFLCVGVQRALEAGAEAIHLEEPEFWVRGGYEPNFQREWQAYYNEPWQPPHSSPEAQWRASKLKYFLYRRALAQVFDFVKEWGKKNGKTIPCYVPTHSQINYAHWRIVSPESSLLSVGCDGYIAQVWTGTARTPNVYEGVTKERTFEAAFCEYGAMQNLVKASGRKVWYLNDPIEDNPNHDWDDYRSNWRNTLIASLFQPDVWRFEIMPWPHRIFQRPYREKAGSDKKVPIPPEYETELQAVITALGDMKQPDWKWEVSGTHGVGVLFSDTMMFQRGEPTPSDEHLGNFYGLAMPLLKAGLPLEPVQIENAGMKNFLKPYRVLLLTYEGQKPPTPEFHNTLAKWVKDGGALIVVDNDADPYHKVREWWNTAPNAFATPRHHLFRALGLADDATGQHKVGKGTVIRLNESPAALTYRKEGAEQIRTTLRDALKAIGERWTTASGLVLRRGPYLVCAGLDETAEGIRPESPRTGRFVALFSGDLPIVRSISLTPGQRGLFVDLDRFPRDRPRIVAAACRVSETRVSGNSIRFRADGIADTPGVVRLILPRAPREVRLNGTALPTTAYDWEDGTLRVRFDNSPESVAVEVLG